MTEQEIEEILLRAEQAYREIVQQYTESNETSHAVSRNDVDRYECMPRDTDH